MSSFVFNEDVFNAVLSEINNNKGSHIPQPLMIIGQEGSGKTTLLNRLYKSCKDRLCIWIDGRNIFSSSDIIESGSIATDSIIFIDNIDYYFIRCSYDEQYRLRRFLYNEGAPMVISTVSKVLPAISEYEAPFFEGVKTIYINPVSDKELALIFGSNILERAIGLLSFLPSTIKSVIIIYNIIKLNNNQEQDLCALLSIFSDKYNSLYQSQPTYSQCILNALGTKSTGMMIPEIRDVTGLKTSILTAYLKSLKTNSIINIDSSKKKHTVYTIKDPLFLLWLQNS